MRYLVSIFLFTIFMFANTNVKVCVFNHQPLIYSTPNEKPKGIFIDILEEVSKKNNWTLQYQHNTFTDCLTNLKNETSDLLVSFADSKERRKTYDFADETIVSTWIQVFSKPSLKVKTFNDLEGKTIAGIKGYIQFKKFTEMMNKFGLKFKVYEVKTVSEAFKAVEDGKADALFTEYFSSLQYLQNTSLVKQPLIFSPYSTTFGTKRGANQDVIKAINDYIKEQKQYPDSQYYHILNKWFAEAYSSAIVKTNIINLTEKEKQWIRENPIVTIAPDPDYPPFEFIDKDGEYKGIVAEYLKIMTKRLGLDIKIAKSKSYIESVELLKENKAHILATASKTPEFSKDFLFGKKAYYDASNVIITRQGNDTPLTKESLKGKKILLVKGWSKAKESIKELYPDSQIVEVESTLSGMIKVSFKEYDYIVTSLPSASYFIKTKNLTNLKVTSFLQLSNNVETFMVHKKNEVLYNLLNKAYESLYSDEKDAITRKWLGNITFLKENTKELVKLTADERKWIAENSVVTIAPDPDYPPFEFIDEKGEYKGIVVDYLNLMADRVGLKYELVKTKDYGEAKKLVMNQKADILPTAIESLELNENYLFGNKSYYEAAGVLISRQENNKAITKENLANKKILVVKGWNKAIEMIRKQYPKSIIVEIPSSLEGLLKVSFREYDYMVTNLPVATYYIKQKHLSNLKVVSTIKYESAIETFMLHKNNKTLHSILKKAFNSLSPEEKNKIEKKWLGDIGLSNENKKKVILTPQERKWLDEHSTIKVAAERGWAPISFVEDGILTGISIEYLEIIAKTLNIKFEYVKDKTWTELLNMARNKEVDLFCSIANTEIRREFLKFSKPHLTYDNAVFALNDAVPLANIESLENKKIAVVKGYMIDEMMTKEYPNFDFMRVDTVGDGLLALQTHEVDVFIGNIMASSYYLGKLGLSNVKIIGRSPYNYELGFGARDDYGILLNIIQKVLDTITEEEKNLIEQKWNKVTFENVVDYTTIYIVIGISLFVLILFTIWNRKLASEVSSRQKAEEKFKNLVENLEPNYIVYMTDIEGIIKYISPSASKYFNKPISEIENSHWGTLAKWTDDTLERGAEVLEKRKKGISTSYQILEYFDDKDEKISFEITENIIYENDVVVGVNGIAKDITESLKLQEKLKKAKLEAESANKAKSEFLSNMSHEIRTPMNAIIGFTDILSNSNIPQTEKSYIETIKRSANALLRIINDILDLSKIEAGKLDIQPHVFNPKILIEDIKALIEPKVKQKGIVLESIIDENLPKAMILDEVRLRQIMFNLLGNAIKFTHEGKVTIDMKKKYLDKDKSKVDLMITVSDSGIGIGEDDIQRIFEPFEQQSSQSVKQYGGTGLGLSITKKLVSLMNGTIDVESQKGVGSTFYINFHDVPVANIAHHDSLKEQEEKEKISIKFKKAKILIVDDITTNLELLKIYFKSHPFDLLEATNGEEAVTMATGNLPDLIIMDIKMPVMDGFEASKILKNNDKTKHIPIIALSASVHNGEYEDESLNELFVDKLNKPIRFKELLVSLSHILENEVASKEEAVQNEAKSIEFNNTTVLLSHKKEILDFIEQFNETGDFSIINKLIDHIKMISNNEKDLEIFCEDLEVCVENYNIMKIEKMIEDLANRLG